MKFKSQAKRDAGREIYDVTFPSELSSEHVLAWLRSVAGTLPSGRRGLTRDSMVFETWADAAGLKHRLFVPAGSAEYSTAQLRAHARGIVVNKSTDRPEINWTAGIELGMSNPLRQLRIASHADLSASLLAAMGPLQEGETMLVQWVVAPAPYEPVPTPDSFTYSGEFSIKRSLLGNLEASKDEVNDRRQKLSEQNLLGLGRVVVEAATPQRSSALLKRIEASLSAASSGGNYFKSKGRGSKLIFEANTAATPLIFPAQFTLTELAGVISWPIGQPFIPGLARGASRQLFATADVSTTGLVLGDSTYFGHERPIAMRFEDLTQHMFVTGGPGAGKTNLMDDVFAQSVEAGHGAVVIDAAPNESEETMFNGALRYIVKERVQDVIVMDPTKQSTHPIGFNIFDQLSPEAVAGQMMTLFKTLYNDINGVWLPQLLYHGIFTLAEYGNGLSIVDLIPLLSPQTPEEKKWAEHVRSSVKSQQVREWWERWQRTDASKRDSNLEPLYNRIWQLTSRPEIINIIGQSHSTFNMRDVIANNKVLLVNLAGMAPDTARILGTLLMETIWSAAQSMTPKKANFLFLDEFQVMTSSYSVRLDEFLRLARKNRLGLIMATQYLTDGVPSEVRRAAINNAKTKVVFRVASEEARIWSNEIDGVDTTDFKNQPNYEAIVRIASSSGVADVTMRSRPPRRAYGTERAVREYSRKTYGRPLADVVEERQKRRSAPTTGTRERPFIGVEEW